MDNMQQMYEVMTMNIVLAITDQVDKHDVFSDHLDYF